MQRKIIAMLLVMLMSATMLTTLAAADGSFEIGEDVKEKNINPCILGEIDFHKTVDTLGKGDITDIEIQDYVVTRLDTLIYSLSYKIKNVGNTSLTGQQQQTDMGYEYYDNEWHEHTGEAQVHSIVLGVDKSDWYTYTMEPDQAGIHPFCQDIDIYNQIENDNNYRSETHWWH